MKTENDNIISEISQPFEKDTLGCERYRIPAVITLDSGRVLAAADMRYDHGRDAPGNLDIITAYSDDDCKSWTYVPAHHFPDCADGTQSSDSASYNDSALVQSKRTGRIFIVTSAFPSGCGAFASKKGTGFIKDKNGAMHLALTDRENETNISNYKFFIGDFEGDRAKIVGADGYTVDRELDLYLNDEPLYMQQINSDKKVRQNVFFSGSAFHIFPTCYLTVRHSDDGGETWSRPHILNADVKYEDETFFGICPGRGAIVEKNGKERIIFCAYNIKKGVERVSTVYTDDNGLSWHRGKSMAHERGLGKSSESQIINMPGNELRIFCRNKSKFVGTAVSTDGGESWSLLKADEDLFCTKNCMVSFINTSKLINNRQVILGSYACGADERKNGVIRVGLMDEKGEIEWKNLLRLNDGFFAYSCMTQLSDGRIACLFEDEPAHITLRLFCINDDCTLTAFDEVYYNEQIKSSMSLGDKIKYMLMKFIDFGASK